MKSVYKQAERQFYILFIASLLSLFLFLYAYWLGEEGIVKGNIRIRVDILALILGRVSLRQQKSPTVRATVILQLALYIYCVGCAVAACVILVGHSLPIYIRIIASAGYMFLSMFSYRSAKKFSPYISGKSLT